MTAVRAVAPQPYPSDRWRRPALRLVRQPLRHAPRLPFVALVVVLLSAGLVGLLLLSMQRAQASFSQSALATRNAALADQLQALQRQVERDSNPAVLATRARALGMVPEASAGYVGPGGRILGPVPSGAPRPAPAASPRAGVVVARPAPAPAKRAAASPAKRPAAPAAGR